MEFEQTTLDSAAISAGFLGRMYLRGEIGKGRMDYQKAKLWFERGAEYVSFWYGSLGFSHIRVSHLVWR